MQRRAFLGSTLAAFATQSFGNAFAASDAAENSERRELVARPSTASLVGMPYPPTPVWAFGGDVPGPEIRLRRGESLSLAVVNALEVPTSVHWHGVRVPWRMDGVAGLTQPPVRPGERFDVDFTPPDAGT